MNTVNRRPSLVDTPTSKQIQTQYFHQNEWKGICEDKNTFGVDQNTFAECENVYVDRDNVLCNRPGLVLRNLPTNFANTNIKLDIYDVFSNIRIDWGNGDVIDYIAPSDNYTYYYQNYLYKQSGKYFGKATLLPPSRASYNAGGSAINRTFMHNSNLTKLVLGTNAYGINGYYPRNLVYFLSGCSSLKELHIQKIGSEGLAGSAWLWNDTYGEVPSNCKLVLYDTTPPAIDNQALQNSSWNLRNTISKVYVPAQSVNTYKTASVWSQLADIIEASTNIAIPLQEDTTFEIEIPEIQANLIKIQTTRNFIIYAYQIENVCRFRIIDSTSYKDFDVENVSSFYAYELGNKLFIFTFFKILVYDNNDLIDGNEYIYVPSSDGNGNYLKNLLIANSYKANKTIKYENSNWPTAGYNEIINSPSLQNDLLKINEVSWPYPLSELRYVISAKTLIKTDKDFVIINNEPYYLTEEITSYINNGYVDTGIIIQLNFNKVIDSSPSKSSKTISVSLGGDAGNIQLAKVSGCSLFKSQGKYYIGGITVNNRDYYNLFLIEYNLYTDNLTLLNTYYNINIGYYSTAIKPIFGVNQSSIIMVTALGSSYGAYYMCKYTYITSTSGKYCKIITENYDAADALALRISRSTLLILIENKLFLTENWYLDVNSTALPNTIEIIKYSDYFYVFNKGSYYSPIYNYQAKNVLQLNKIFQYSNKYSDLFSQVIDVFVDNDAEVWFNTKSNGIFTTKQVSLLANYLYSSSSDIKYVFSYSVDAEYTGEVPSLIRPIGSNSFLYFVKDTSYILQVRYNNETLQLYLPEGKENKYYDSVIDAEQTSDKSLVVIGNNVLYSVVDTGNVDDKQLPIFQYIQSKLNLRVIENSDSIIAYNSSTLLMPTYNGIAAVNYSQLISVEEQTVNYITDNIMTHWFNFVKSGTIKTCNHNYYLFVYNTNRNDLYMFDYRSSTWWYFTFKKKVKLMHTIGLYCFIVFEDNTLHYFDEKVLDAQWSITSQKLFLGNNTNYKQIRRFTVHTVGEKSKDYSYQSGDGDNVMTLQFTNYRKRMYENDDETFNFNVDFVRTYVIRLNYPKVYEFQYKLSSNKINLKPLALTGITIEYKVGGKVR